MSLFMRNYHCVLGNQLVMNILFASRINESISLIPHRSTNHLLDTDRFHFSTENNNIDNTPWFFFVYPTQRNEYHDRLINCLEHVTSFTLKMTSPISILLASNWFGCKIVAFQVFQVD